MKGKAIARGVVLAVLVAATLNIAYQIYCAASLSYQAEKLYETTGVIACSFGPSEDEVARYYIELALIISFIGSRLKYRVGRVFYLFGLVASLVVYASWWRIYSQIQRAAETTLELPNVAHLYNADYWDICIFAVVLALLSWELIRLISSCACLPNRGRFSS